MATQFLLLRSQSYVTSYVTNRQRELAREAGISEHPEERCDDEMCSQYLRRPPRQTPI